MPRKARLDTPGTLHHVIIRGIERRRIVNNNTDREDFVSRMGHIALDTETVIYAWSLMTNHAHILLRSGSAGLSTYMRRLLTGYALSYNLRHSRHGRIGLIDGMENLVAEKARDQLVHAVVEGCGEEKALTPCGRRREDTGDPG